MQKGNCVLFDIDWQGARQIESKLSCVALFILPPSRQALEDRLKSRAQDAFETIVRRLNEASEEISHYHEFDYIVINDDFQEALADIRAIIRARRRGLHAQRIACAGLIRELLATR